MTATRPYISHLRYGDGVILIGYSRSGRFRKPADTWMRLRFMTALLPAELKTQRRPFRLIRSLRAAAVKAWTFDRKLRQSPAADRIGPREQSKNH